MHRASRVPGSARKPLSLHPSVSIVSSLLWRLLARPSEALPADRFVGPRLPNVWPWPEKGESPAAVPVLSPAPSATVLVLATAGVLSSTRRRGARPESVCPVPEKEIWEKDIRGQYKPRAQEADGSSPASRRYSPCSPVCHPVGCIRTRRIACQSPSSRQRESSSLPAACHSSRCAARRSA